MDIPEYAHAYDTPPPPSNNEIIACPFNEGIPVVTQPQLYSNATAPPTYKETETFQKFSNRTDPDPYPVLSMPRVTMVNHTEQVFMQQIVRNEAPQVIMMQPQQIAIALGDTPTPTVCKYCQKSILTVVEYKPGWAAWAMCCLLTVLGLICGICLIPFCVRGFKDAHHSCPYCHRHLGIYVRK